MATNESKSNFTLSMAGFLGFSRLRDYKRLNKYLIDVHKASDFESITSELSKCINDIFDHEFFALAVKAKGKMMVWVEPSVFKDTITSVIEKDFSFDENISMYPVNVSKTGLLKEKNVRDDLFGKSFSGDNFQAKLYILPGKKVISRYHSDIISDIVFGLGNAVSKYISIQELKDAASVDPLTGCYNRRELEKKINEQFSECKRYEKDFSLIMFDIDFFKQINDTHGHQAGDDILTGLSQRIRGLIREEDNFFRYGGEEFVLILPETSTYKAFVLAQRLRTSIASEKFKSEDKEIKVTASFGVSSFKGSSGPEDMLKKADSLLYKAKESGRNKVMSNLIRVCGKNTDVAY
ncbi:MAG: GGDEF domain-containing protein [Thermodesulfobacteriota bacterium]